MMRKIDFSCTLLSDVVINADANTEGNIMVHDYVPGSNFLGIVAKAYDRFGDRAFDVFHSGKIRFGDAHPVLGDEIALRPPLSWHFQKGTGATDGELFNLLWMSEKDLRSLTANNIQLKQLRNGFFAAHSNTYTSLNHRYYQKSAYDAKKRRSKTGSMFGYSSLAAGLVLGFSLHIDENVEEEIVKRVIDLLEGEHRLGKSRSAQYGRVIIKRMDTAWSDPVTTSHNDNGSMFIYSRGRLAFANTQGHPILQPDPILLHLPEGAGIDWHKSHIRVGSLASYNGARRTRDYRRFYLDKGSVLVVKNLPRHFDPIQWLDMHGGALGNWRSEGFGDVLINPHFLKEQRITLLRQSDRMGGAIAQTRRKNEKLSAWLKMRHTRKVDELEILSEVKKFIQENASLYRGISASQWGTLRAFCRYDDFLQRASGYVESGEASKKQWEGERKAILWDVLKKMDNERGRFFLQLLASEMVKETRRNRRGEA